MVIATSYENSKPILESPKSKRCFTFRRTAIPEQMRKRLDKGLKLICLLAFKGRGENFPVQSY